MGSEEAEKVSVNYYFSEYDYEKKKVSMWLVTEEKQF